MRLSVIIPAFDAGDRLGNCLDALALQIGPDTEVIAVDDASSDDTLSVTLAYPWLRVVRHDQNRGVAAARNSGARASTGDVLVFLDADTVPGPDLLQRIHRYLAEHPEIDAASGCYADRNPGSHTSGFARYLDVSEAAMRQEALDRPAPGTLSGSLCAIRREIFLRLGGFSEDRSLAVEDIELGFRLTRAGYIHWLVSDWSVGHRQPGLLGYVRELVPRTRSYLRLIRYYGAFNEMMGGRREGAGRLAFLAAIFSAPALLLDAPLAIMVGAAFFMALAAVLNRELLNRLYRAEGAGFIPAGLFFHAITSLAIVTGGVLAAGDLVRHSWKKAQTELAVVLAFLASFFSPSGAYLILYLTHRCNARCGHCFDEAQRDSIAKECELDLARHRRLAASIGRLGHLSLTGGEPLLRDDLPEIFAAWYAAGVRSFSLSTNGAYPERLSAFLISMLDRAPHARLIVTLSVDGVGPRHDQLRRLPGLFAKLEESLSRLQTLRMCWPQLRVHGCLTLSEQNAEAASETVAWMQRWQFDQFELNRLRGAPADPALRTPPDLLYDQLRSQISCANGRARGLARIFSGLDRRMFDIVRHWQSPWPCGPCLAGRRLLVIHADGTVLPCEMLRTVRAKDAAQYAGFALGNLGDHDDDLPRLLAGDARRRLRTYITDTRCRCPFECAIFATMAYRPWRLPLSLFRRSSGPNAPGPEAVADLAAKPVRFLPSPGHSRRP